VKAKQLQLVRT